MQVELKVNNNVTVVADGEKHTEIFEKLSSLQEVFGEEKCGKCGGNKLRFMTRQDKDENKYYELHCQNSQCRAKLAYGCHKKGGGLFPKRFVEVEGSDKKEVKGKWGWTIYSKETGKEE